uniref:Uncharacterized protein n=1 Tax=Octopus bimaculoides TaxID=37653 RepID=A0A0L8HIR0_OCTBM
MIAVVKRSNNNGFLKKQYKILLKSCSCSSLQLISLNTGHFNEFAFYGLVMSEADKPDDLKPSYGFDFQLKAIYFVQTMNAV